jgi:hypothetical protein
VAPLSGTATGEAFLETWPSWLERRIVSQVPQDLQQLNPGEQEAIALAHRGVSQPCFFLVFFACGRFLSTSARRIDCQVLAEEMAPLEVAWSATATRAVTAPGIETAR